LEATDILAECTDCDKELAVKDSNVHGFALNQQLYFVTCNWPPRGVITFIKKERNQKDQIQQSEGSDHCDDKE
jgi:hypothetical protein